MSQFPVCTPKFIAHSAVWGYLPIQKQNKSSKTLTEEKLPENGNSRYTKFRLAHFNGQEKIRQSLIWYIYIGIYTYLQNKRMRRCGVPPPPPIIFERLKLSQQIIYRRKENLSESPNHQKYWENILVSRFYEQFLRNRRNLGHFGSSKKFQTLRIQTYYTSF